MQRDAMFRGCTRPPMFLGVPYVPFFLGAGSVLLLAMYINLFVLAALPMVIFVMRAMASRDDMIFRLLWLHLLLRQQRCGPATQQGSYRLVPTAPRHPCREGRCR
ncbi:VirB3 family type IV secretion system protein [Stenotrophomonas sp. C3(2023)]|uniref:VirB3 family type IV secretion system protein n=1 Tax=Stenotrophomonas sp. C3(2023) TaxID=3080277 RepID=UPI00293CF7A3|nr:VirB3 family type IV secretion system protein [Stenotrophomonas sp. C3(2023)]MDV3468444.1 VirB3 family type IV secretion system protein [Stenotrophomonas sp. C3(2023)]